jgi:hypothetical protein
MEIRYSMFYALFAHTAILPVMRWAAARAGVEEADPWRLLQWSLGRKTESAGDASIGAD